MASNQGLVLTSYSDVPECIDRINDTLITRLGRANRSDDRPNVAARRALWKHVFSDGWTTASPNVAPASEPKPNPADGYAVQIGRFINDLPPVPIRPELRIVTGYWGPNGPGGSGPDTLPPRRKAGADAWLRVRLNTDANLGIIFEIVDARGDLANPNGDPSTTILGSLTQVYGNVELCEEFDNIREARSQAMLRHDSAIIYNIASYNLQWIIHWARNRLVKVMELLRQIDRQMWDRMEWETAGGNSSLPRVTARLAGTPDEDKLTVVESGEEDYNMLRTITTCSDVIRELTRIEVLEDRYGMEMRTILANSGL